jgi:GT2 family glycosyltransferase
MGDRAAELDRAIGSVRAQDGVDAEVIVVVNGADVAVPAADESIVLETNVGIPGGRNRGAAAARGELVCFLDDDAVLVGPDVLAGAAATFDARPDVAAVALQVVTPDGGTARRHHPRLRGNPDLSGDVTSFPGGASVVRRSAFDEVGGLCDEFFYGLEETDLAWRLIDRGWCISYAGELRVEHPKVEPQRHASFHRHTARNRVWLAHRSLPLLLAGLYVIDWFAISAVRAWRQPRAILATAAGTLEALRRPIGPRRPMSWRTAWQLTRLGRPPVV